MSAGFERPLIAELRHELNALRGNWLWFVVLGGALIALGIIALGAVVIASLAAALAIGILLLLGGAAEAIGADFRASSSNPRISSPKVRATAALVGRLAWPNASMTIGFNWPGLVPGGRARHRVRTALGYGRSVPAIRLPR